VKSYYIFSYGTVPPWFLFLSCDISLLRVAKFCVGQLWVQPGGPAVWQQNMDSLSSGADEGKISFYGVPLYCSNNITRLWHSGFDQNLGSGTISRFFFNQKDEKNYIKKL